jgi:hypothetical protein
VVVAVVADLLAPQHTMDAVGTLQHLVGVDVDLALLQGARRAQHLLANRVPPCRHVVGRDRLGSEVVELRRGIRQGSVQLGGCAAQGERSALAVGDIGPA